MSPMFCFVAILHGVHGLNGFCYVKVKITTFYRKLASHFSPLRIALPFNALAFDAAMQLDWTSCESSKTLPELDGDPFGDT